MTRFRENGEWTITIATFVASTIRLAFFYSTFPNLLKCLTSIESDTLQTILPISTKWTIISHLNSLTTKTLDTWHWKSKVMPLNGHRNGKELRFLILLSLFSTWLFMIYQPLFWFGLVFWYLMPLSTIFRLYRGSQFYLWRTRRKSPTCHKSLTNVFT